MGSRPTVKCHRGGLLTLRFGQMLTHRWGLGLRIEMGGGGADGKTSATSGLGLEAQFNPLRDLAVRGRGAGLRQRDGS